MCHTYHSVNMLTILEIINLITQPNIQLSAGYYITLASLYNVLAAFIFRKTLSSLACLN